MAKDLLSLSDMEISEDDESLESEVLSDNLAGTLPSSISISACRGTSFLVSSIGTTDGTSSIDSSHGGIPYYQSTLEVFDDGSLLEGEIDENKPPPSENSSKLRLANDHSIINVF